MHQIRTIHPKLACILKSRREFLFSAYIGSKQECWHIDIRSIICLLPPFLCTCCCVLQYLQIITKEVKPQIYTVFFLAISEESKFTAWKDWSIWIPFCVVFGDSYRRIGYAIWNHESWCFVNQVNGIPTIRCLIMINPRFDW